MLAQLRRDPIVGTITLAKGAVLALNSGVMASLVAALAARSESGFPMTWAGSLCLVGLIWFSIAPFLLFGSARERCRTLDLALPIAARRLWLAHVLALILLGVAFLAASLGVLWVMFWAFRNAPVDSSQIKQALVGMLLPAAASLVLIVILLQRTKASLCQIPSSPARTISSMLLLGCGFAVMVLLYSLPAPAALVPLGLSIYLGCRTYRNLPPALTWVPADSLAGIERPEASRAMAGLRAAEAEEWDMPGKRGSLRGFWFGWFLIRLLCLNIPRKRYAAVFFSPLFFLWGLAMSGFFASWKEIELPQFSYVILSGFLLLSFLPMQMLQLPSVDFLPISRNRLAAFLLIPGLLFLALGLGAGAAGIAIIARRQLQIQLRTSATYFMPPYSAKAPMVRVPAEYCEISWDSEPQDVVSPWGESHPVWKYRLFPNSRITVYSPFSTPEGSSPRYIAFQISRAIEAIYGASIPYQEILDRHLDISAAQTVSFKNPDRLLADHPEWRLQGDIALAPVLSAVIGIAYAIMACIYFRACRAGISDSRRMAVFIATAIASFAATGAQIAVMVARWVRMDVGAAFLKITLLGMVRTIPGGALTVWILCALALWGILGLCQRQFRRIEMLPARTGRTYL